MIKFFDKIPTIYLERCGFPINYNLLNDDQKDLLECIFELVPKHHESKVDDLQEDLDYLAQDVHEIKERLTTLIQKLQKD